MKTNRKTMMTPAEISLFCQQAELLLSSGLPLHEGVPTLAEEYAGTPYAKAMTALGEEVSVTGSLYAGMKESPLFPVYMREMVRIGETTGQLENVLHGLTAYYDREEAIRKAVRSAVTYPLVLIAMMAVVILVLVAKVLPIFRGIMADMGIAGNGGSLLNLGAALGSWVLVLTGIVLVTVLGTLVWRHFSPAAADRLIVRVFPPYRQVRHKLNAARFAGILQMILSSGFPLSESLALLDRVFDDEEMLAKVRDLQQAVEEGRSFPEAVEKSGIFDPLYGKMIRLGFDAGRADQVMGRLNAVYEADMDEQISHLVSMLEPTLVAVLSVIIGAILLAVMLPLAGVLTGVS